MYYYLVYVLVFAMLFFPSKTQVNKQAIFTVKDSLILRGFACLIIIFHHIGKQGFPDELGINNEFGGLGVALFFLLSSYGLLKTAKRANFNYLKRLVFVKIPSLFLILVLTNLIYYFVFVPTQNFWESIIYIFNLEIFYNGATPTLNYYSWFVTTILIFYIFFAIALLFAKLFKTNRQKEIFITILISVFVILFWILVLNTNINELYLRSISCFVLGAFVVCFEKQILSLRNKKDLLAVLIYLFIAMLVVSKLFLNEELMSVSFVCVMVLLATFLNFENNKTLGFFGGISLGFYLFQRMFILLIPNNVNSVLYILVIFGSTLVVAYIVHQIKFFAKKFVKYIFPKNKK